MKKIIINHRNSTKAIYPKSLIEKTLTQYLQDKLSFDTIVISVWAVGESRIRQLNAKFRQIDSVTDVLSFTAFNRDETEMINLGEIVYCPKIVTLQAKRFNQLMEDELRLYLRHSIDHLLEEYNSRRVNAKTTDSNRS